MTVRRDTQDHGEVAIEKKKRRREERKERETGAIIACRSDNNHGDASYFGASICGYILAAGFRFDVFVEDNL